MTADRFHSLAHLQDEHSKLVRTAGRNVSDPRNRQLISDFVTAAVATGAVLETKDERAAAQGLIGYWTARLIATTREVARPVAVAAGGSDDPEVTDPLESIDTLLAEFDPAQVTAATTRTDAWVGTLTDETDRALVRRILIRLVRLQEDGTAVHDPVSRFALDELEPRQRTGELLGELQRLGVVRVETRPNGTEEVSLTSGTFVETWPYLRKLIADRRRFRELAEQWRNGREAARTRAGGRPFVKRVLLNVGRWVDRAWERTLRAFGGQVVATPDPASGLPDAEFYRYRNQTEIDFQYYRRTLAQENADWLRVVKGVSLIAVLALLIAGVVAFMSRQIELHETASRQKQAEARHESDLLVQKLESADAEKRRTDFELGQRRKRQRLKEHVELVRLLAQYRQYSNPQKYPLSNVALWKIQAPISRQKEEQRKHYQDELTLIGVESAADGPLILRKPSANPLEVAHRIRDELIRDRISDPASDNYDKDTVSYRNGLIRELYATAGRLAEAIHRLLTEPCDENQPHDYRALAGYIDEFRILYWGEMAVVESKAVEEAMIAFGDALKAVDEAFEIALESELRTVDPKADRGKSAAKGYWNAEAKSYYWCPAETAAVVSKRADFVSRSITDLRESLGPGFDKRMETLEKSKGELKRALEKELAEFPDSVEKK